MEGLILNDAFSPPPKNQNQMKKWVISWGYLFVVISCFAQQDSLSPTTIFQNLSNWRTVWVDMKQQKDTLTLDSLTVLPTSLSIRYLKNNQILDTNSYKITNNQLIWKESPLLKQHDKLQIRFRVLPYAFGKPLARKDTAWISEEIFGRVPNRFKYNPYEELRQVSSSGLNYNGTFARGVSFGNNQDLVLNSSFNLQLAGKLGDDVEIIAAISDNNIPLQPEGNTQQLQEFDKIFIQLRRGKQFITAGDYELKRPTGYFMNYYKKLQGITLGTALKLTDEGILKTTASAAISRGQFGRNVLQTQEGNQGPYKLRGNNGELFIIVLAGTEKVFIDGMLMKRGQEFDYVIDYNRGEVRFTPNRLITKDSRVQVEFEYSDQNYQRSMYAVSSIYETPKLKLHFNLFSEQDGRTPTTQGELSELQQQALAMIGDDVGTAFITGIDTAVFSADRILYKLVDTLVNGLLYDSVLVYSTNQDSAKFEARFSEVGIGNGNYIRLQSSANGAVYGWVAPDPLTGQPTGTYEPIISVVAPAQNQLYTLGLDYTISKTSTLQAEVTLSNQDLNRLSLQDGDDNIGGGVKLGYTNRVTLGQQNDSTQPATLTVNADYEFVDRNFKPLNPYRPREFTRDWNTANLAATQEHIAKGGFTLAKRQWGNLRYEFSAFLKDSLYTGMRHLGIATLQRKGYDIRAEANYLTTEGQSNRTTFFRPKLNISKTFKKLNNWQVGIYGEREKNSRYGLLTDTLQNTSFFYDLMRLYVKSADKSKVQLNMNYMQRLDYVPVETEFQQNTKAEELNLEGTWQQKGNSNLKFNLTYRNLAIVDSNLTTLAPQETYLGRIEYGLSLKRGWLRATTLYEIGSGQEQKIQYNYIKVESGQGLYTWIDRNQDSVKQLNEFEIAAFADQADHIRVTTFTDEFIRSNTVRFNQSLAINPKAIWFTQRKGIKRLLSKFSTQSAWQITRKVREAAGVSPWNPFQLAIPDSALVSLVSNIRNSLFFNRTDPKFSIELGMFENRNRVVLTSGFESRGREEYFLRFRWNLNPKIGLQINFSQGQNTNDSELFDSRDYAIDVQKIEPKFTFYLLKRTFRAEAKYKYQNSQNTIGDLLESAVAHDANVELIYNRVNKSSYRLSFSYVNVNYTGLPNTPVEFTMLEGLKNGQNYLWTLTFDRRLARNVQLSMSYEGRKTGENRIVHVGRAQVRANF